MKITIYKHFSNISYIKSFRNSANISHNEGHNKIQIKVNKKTRMKKKHPVLLFKQIYPNENMVKLGMGIEKYIYML